MSLDVAQETLICREIVEKDSEERPVKQLHFGLSYPMPSQTILVEDWRTGGCLYRHWKREKVKYKNFFHPIPLHFWSQFKVGILDINRCYIDFDLESKRISSFEEFVSFYLSSWKEFHSVSESQSSDRQNFIFSYIMQRRRYSAQLEALMSLARNPGRLGHRHPIGIRFLVFTLYITR